MRFPRALLRSRESRESDRPPLESDRPPSRRESEPPRESDRPPLPLPALDRPPGLPEFGRPRPPPLGRPPDGRPPPPRLGPERRADEDPEALGISQGYRRIPTKEAKNGREPPFRAAQSSCETGGDLLSQGESAQVPSAQLDLTSVFEMGTGVTPALSLPRR